MSMAQNTMNLSQLLQLSNEEITTMAEEHLATLQNVEVEDILNNYSGELSEEDVQCLAEFILDTQNQMPH